MKNIYSQKKVRIFALFGISLVAGVALASVTVGLSTTGISQDVSYTQLVLNKPAGVNSGDVLVAGISVNGGSGASVTAPSGWALISRTDNEPNVSVISYYKVVSLSEPSDYTWIINPQARASGGISRFSGVSTNNPIDVVINTTGRGSSATAPSVTTASDNEPVLALFGSDYGKSTSSFFGTTTSMTKLFDIKNIPFGPTTALEYVVQVLAGASGTKTASFNSGQHDWAAQTIALRLGSPSSHIYILASKCLTLMGRLV